jgi:hypothetical protein
MDRDFQIPAALQPYATQRRWVVWRTKKKKDGKSTKVPYRPDDPLREAKSNDPSTWSDAATAIAVAVEYDFDGIGLCLKDGELGAFDIDHCRNPDTGVIDPYAVGLIERAKTYTEITPSETGLRIIGHYFGELRDGKKQKVPGSNGVSVETYRASTRYITVTANRLDGTPEELSDITELMDATVAELEAANGKARAKDDDDDDDDDRETSLPAELKTRLYIADAGNGKPHASYASRSELFFAFVTDCLKARVAAKAIVAACLDDIHGGHAVYEHCRENGGRAYVLRQIEQAREVIKERLDAAVADLNKDHAFVLVGDKGAVMMFEKINGREQFRLGLSSFQTFS